MFRSDHFQKDLKKYLFNAKIEKHTLRTEKLT